MEEISYSNEHIKVTGKLRSFHRTIVKRDGNVSPNFCISAITDRGHEITIARHADKIETKRIIKFCLQANIHIECFTGWIRAKHRCKLQPEARIKIRNVSNARLATGTTGGTLRIRKS